MHCFHNAWTYTFLITLQLNFNVCFFTTHCELLFPIIIWNYEFAYLTKRNNIHICRYTSQFFNTATYTGQSWELRGPSRALSGWQDLSHISYRPTFQAAFRSRSGYQTQRSAMECARPKPALQFALGFCCHKCFKVPSNRHARKHLGHELLQ